MNPCEEETAAIERDTASSELLQDQKREVENLCNLRLSEIDRERSTAFLPDMEFHIEASMPTREVYNCIHE